MKIHIGILFVSLIFLLCVSVFAEGYVQPFYHNNGTYYSRPHNDLYEGYYYNHSNKDWHDGTFNVDTWNNGVWDDYNNTGVVVGVPNPSYHNSPCAIIDDCSSGTCVLVNTCDEE